MRISTSQIFDAGALGIQNGQSSLYKQQNQMSSGRRVLTPQDDPVAAAQALVVTQTQGVNAQYIQNQGQATSQLGMVDSQLTSLVDLLQNVRERVVQAGNTTLAQSDRAAIATELDSRLSEMLGIANSDNGVGEYLFSGYRGNVLPFAVDTTLGVSPPAASASIGYFGDEGERLLQVSSSRQMAISVAGSDLFMTAKKGNGTFVPAGGGNVGAAITVKDPLSTVATDSGTVVDRQQWAAALANPLAGQPLQIIFADPTHYGIYDPVSTLTTGPLLYTSGAAIPLVTGSTPAVDFSAQVVVTGVPVAGDTISISPSSNHGTATVDAGSVLDYQKWAAAVNDTNAGLPVEIRFSLDFSSVPTGVLSYGIYDPVGGLTALKPYTSGQEIQLVTNNGVDFGSQLMVSGQPAVGDTFTVTPSTNQSLFQTMQNLVGILRNPVGAGYTSTQLANDLGAELTNINQAFDNVARVQAIVGTRMQEIDSLGNSASDLDVQYQASLSSLQDLDYAKAISDFMSQKMNLEAAQQSFAKISGLSLFNYL